MMPPPVRSARERGENLTRNEVLTMTHIDPQSWKADLPAFRE